jgi:hypothetical protein
VKTSVGTSQINSIASSGHQLCSYSRILPQVVNIDNRSATVLIYTCSLLCNNNAYAQQYRSDVAMIRLTKQRTTQNGVFQLSDRGSILGPPQGINRDIHGRRFSQQDDSDQFRPSTPRLECHLRRSLLIVLLVIRVLIKQCIGNYQE